MKSLREGALANKLSVQLKLVWLMVVVLVLANCSPPAMMTTVDDSYAAAPSVNTQIYFYPKKGQTTQQQDRDRYECHLWAVQSSNYDPAQAQLAPHQRVEVIPTAPPGSGAATGAVGGAIVGSMLGGHSDRGEGLVLGAITGALLGAGIESSSNAQAQAAAQQENARIKANEYATMEQQSRNYRRAISACLEGRDYTVR